MRVIPVPVDLNILQTNLIRSPGLHMSTIYNDLYQDLEPRRYKRGSEPDANRMGLGFALEEALEAGLKRHLASRPEEMRTEEGIAFSPDLLLHTDITRLGEIKLTWMSSREVPREECMSFPAKFGKYLTQMKAYCHALGTPYARLYAFFVNGDYRKGAGASGPEFLAWDFEFSSHELHDNYRMLLNHARHKGWLP